MSGVQKTTGLVLLAVILLAIIAALIWFRTPTIAPDPTPRAEDGKSLWMASEVPQVGAIMRLGFDDPAHRTITSTTYLDDSLSAMYKPATAGGPDETLTLTDISDVDLGLKFLAKANPGAEAEAKGASSLTLKVRGVQVAQWVSLNDLQNFLRGFDGGRAPNKLIHELFAAINKAGDEQRRTGAMTPYWVITKVFTADHVEYSTDASKNLSANASCGAKGAACVLPTAKLTAKLDLSKDAQHIVTGDNRPIFVVIRPVGTNSTGMVYIEDAVAPPPVIRD